jgi:hypothetical protein
MSDQNSDGGEDSQEDNISFVSEEEPSDNEEV